MSARGAGLHLALEAAVAQVTRRQGSWQLTLHELAHATRTAAIDHPEECWRSLAPSGSDLQSVPAFGVTVWIEAVLQALLAEGFGSPVVPRAYRAYASFVLGHILVVLGEIADRTAEEEAPGGSRAAAARLGPSILALRAPLSVPQSIRDFDDGLEGVFDRLSRMRVESREVSSQVLGPMR